MERVWKKFGQQNMIHLLLRDGLVESPQLTNGSGRPLDSVTLFFSHFASFMKSFFLHSVEEGTAVWRVFLQWVHHLAF